MKLLSKKMARLIFGFFAFAETGEYEDGQRDCDDHKDDTSSRFVFDILSVLSRCC